MRTWRLRRAVRAEDGTLKKAALQQQRRKKVYQPDDLRAVTLVVDADEDLGLVWGNRGESTVVLTKCMGMAKLHPLIGTGMHLISINNVEVDDALQARELCDAAAPGEALTLLLWQPPVPASSPAPSKGSISFNKKKQNATEKALNYVTARVYKDHQDSKTGLTLKTENRIVRIARLSAPAPPHLRVGMRLVGIENSVWFSHHTEAVALIRSLPAGYVTFLLAMEEPHKRSNSLDNTSVATTAPGSWTTPEDDASFMLDSSRRGTESDATPPEPGTPPTATPEEEETREPAPPKLLSATLTPEQAQQVVLTEDDNDVVYLHEPVAHLSAGLEVVSVNGESMASAGHYEHFLQMAEEDVTITVRAAGEQMIADAATIITARAVRPTFETKTGIVLTNGKQGRVLVSRVTADSLFPTLQSGMQVLSINGHDWFTNYQEAIGLIRSLVGEITVVAKAVPEEVV